MKSLNSLRSVFFLSAKWNLAFRLSLCIVVLSMASAGCSRRSASVDDQLNASEETFQWLRSNYGFVHNAPLDRMLSRITGRLQEAIVTRRVVQNGAAFANYPWSVHLLKLDEPNAFSTSAGTIFITRGLLLRLRSEAELATVISHEMAHQLLGHPGEALAEILANVDSSAPQTVPVVAYTVDRELDADSVALRILRAARYDLRDAVYALTVGYRSRPDSVSPQTAQEMDLRVANVVQAIQMGGEFMPATHNSREFMRVQSLL